MNDSSSDEPIFDAVALERCIDESVPPGVIRLDGQPYPIVEFDVTEAYYSDDLPDLVLAVLDRLSACEEDLARLIAAWRSGDPEAVSDAFDTATTFRPPGKRLRGTS